VIGGGEASGGGKEEGDVATAAQVSGFGRTRAAGTERGDIKNEGIWFTGRTRRGLSARLSGGQYGRLKHTV